MSWEFDNCNQCGASMDRIATRLDADGRILMQLRCPNDGTEAEISEPDENLEARKAMQ